MSDQKPPKNRPSWRAPISRNGSPNAVFLGYISKFGDNHPSRRRCVAVARSTGKQCRNDAIQGAAACRVHGGHRKGRLSEEARLGRERVVSLAAGRNGRRKALAKLSTTEPYPEGAPRNVLSPVERGLIIEADQNRLLSPGEWIKITHKHRLK